MKQRIIKVFKMVLGTVQKNDGMGLVEILLVLLIAIIFVMAFRNQIFSIINYILVR